MNPLLSHEIDLLALEQEIVDRLQTLATDQLRVLATPENVDEIKGIKANRLLVAFRGESFGSPENRINPGAPIVQSAEINFTLILQVKDLRSHHGAMRLIPQIRNLITGFAPTITGRSIFQVSTEFIGNENNIWTYALSFSCPTIYRKRAGV